MLNPSRAGPDVAETEWSDPFMSPQSSEGHKTDMS